MKEQRSQRNSSQSPLVNGPLMFRHSYRRGRKEILHPSAEFQEAGVPSFIFSRQLGDLMEVYSLCVTGYGPGAPRNGSARIPAKVNRRGSRNCSNPIVIFNCPWIGSLR